MPTLDVAINARKAKQGAREFDSSAAKVKRSAGDIDRGIAKSDKSINTLGASVKKVAVGMIGMAAAYKGLRFAMASVREFAAFEMGLANVSTMLNVTTMKFMPQYERQLKKMAREFGESTKTLSKGLYDILSASVDAEKAIGVLTVASRAAIAGLTDTGAAADILTTIINAYGMAAEDATRISDILFATVKRGKTTFAELAGSMGMVVSLAATAGLSLEEASAALATMTRAGIKTERAITGLRAILVAFLSPTEQNIKAAKKLGLELNTNTLRTIGLTGAVQKLEGATAEQIAEIFTNVRALTVLAPLLTATEGHMRDLEEVTNSAGKTLEAFAKQTDTTSFKLKRLSEDWKAVKVSFGEFLALTIYSVPEATDAVNELLDAQERLRKLRGQPVQMPLGRWGAMPTPPAIAAPEIKLPSLEFLSKQNRAAVEDLIKTLEELGQHVPGPIRQLLEPTYELAMANKALSDSEEKLLDNDKRFQAEYEAIEKRRQDEIDQFEKRYEKVSDLREKYFKEIETEKLLMGLTSEERERALKLIAFEAAAKKLLGDDTEGLIKLYREELKELGELQATEEEKQRGIEETAKYLDDQASAYRRLYDDLNLQNIQNYEYKIALLNKEREAYERFIDDKILLDQWYNERKRELDRKRDIESENFFVGFRAGIMQIEEETLTWGEIGNQVAQDMNSAFADALMEMTTNGASWKDAMTGFALDIGRSIQKMLAQQIAAQVMMSTMGAIAGIGGAFFGGGAAVGGFGAGGATMFAKKGLVLSRDSVVPYGKGDVISRPTIFPMSNGAIGLGGEEGKEGLMPLGRDSQGRLGVRTSGGEGGRTPIKIINVMDFSQVQEYLNTADGEMQVVNIMRRNSNEIQEVTG